MTNFDLIVSRFEEIVNGSEESRLVVRDRIFAFEAEVAKLPQLELETRHLFSEGLYIREIVIPPNVVMTGAIHKHQCAGVVSKGAMLVATEDGVKHVTAPFTYVARPGLKRAGFSLEETVWTTFHPNPTNETDIDALEDYFFTNDPEWFIKEGAS